MNKKKKMLLLKKNQLN